LLNAKSFDVAIIGGGIIGSAIAYFLASQRAFGGTILVLEKDSTYEKSSTSLSVGGIRQQFSTPENIEISKFSANFIKSIDKYLAIDEDIPDVSFVESGYLFLATEKGWPILIHNYNVQKSHDVEVVLLNAPEIGKRFAWLKTDDIAAGTLGENNEGWLDPYSLLMAFIRKAKTLGVTYREDNVVSIKKTTNRVTTIGLSRGEHINCGIVVNAAGPYARNVSELAGIEKLHVSPRKRFVYLFDCRSKLTGCPLVINPNGVYFRPEGNKFLCGVSPPEDQDPECYDLKRDYSLFENIIWPTLSSRVTVFEQIKLIRSWAGHYAYNAEDQNAILGPHPEITNFLFANGFSGHGLQQAPAVGRAISELITFGEYKTLDLNVFAYDRFFSGNLVKELNVV
jgi:sarcosine oxidase